LDRDTGLSEYGGADHVALVDPRQSSLHVSTRFAGRHGNREYTLGGAGDPPRAGEYNGVLCSGVAVRVSNDPQTPFERSVS